MVLWFTGQPGSGKTTLTNRFIDDKLIGFMKILSDSFCLKWKDKILNVHPSLLPKYAGGMNNSVHKQVLKNKKMKLDVLYTMLRKK